MSDSITDPITYVKLSTSVTGGNRVYSSLYTIKFTSTNAGTLVILPNF